MEFLSSIINDGRRTHLTDVSLTSEDVPNKLTLQAYLKQVLKEDPSLTYGAISRNSKAGGGKGVSKDYVSGIVLGEYSSLGPEKIVALAKGIKRPLREVVEVIFGKLGDDDVVPRDPTLRAIFTEFPSLSAADQKELKLLAEIFLREVRRRKPNR